MLTDLPDVLNRVIFKPDVWQFWLLVVVVIVLVAHRVAEGEVMIAKQSSYFALL